MGKHGKEVWSRPFADIRTGESATLAPLVVKNLVIVGNSELSTAYEAISTRSMWTRVNRCGAARTFQSRESLGPRSGRRTVRLGHAAGQRLDRTRGHCH